MLDITQDDSSHTKKKNAFGISKTFIHRNTYRGEKNTKQRVKV